MFGNFFTKRVALGAAAFAAVAVGGIASVSIIPALAAGISGGNASTLAATPAPSTAKTGNAGAKAVAAKHIALALFRESVKETGLSRTTVLKDLLNGETLAQIDGSKAQAVDSAVIAKITTRLNKAVTNGKITKTQETTLSSAATARRHQAHEPQPQHLHPGSLRRIHDQALHVDAPLVDRLPRRRDGIERRALILSADRQSTRPPRVDCLDAQEDYTAAEQVIDPAKRYTAHHQDRPRRHRHRPRPAQRAEVGQQLRLPRPRRLLRRSHLPSHRRRLRDPGWVPRGHRSRRSRLQVRR